MANFYFLLKSKLTCGQSYKASTIVIYDSRVVNISNLLRLATGLHSHGDASSFVTILRVPSAPFWVA